MKTIPQGDNGDVLAPFGSRDHLIRGKRVLLRITGKSSDQKVPHIIKDGLIGVQIEAVFTKDQLVRQIGSSCKKLPDNCMIVYIEELVSALRSLTRTAAATSLEGLMRTKVDIYILEVGTYEICS